jgi:hypothetical protein
MQLQKLTIGGGISIHGCKFNVTCQHLRVSQGVLTNTKCVLKREVLPSKAQAHTAKTKDFSHFCTALRVFEARKGIDVLRSLKVKANNIMIQPLTQTLIPIIQGLPACESAMANLDCDFVKEICTCVSLQVSSR